MIYILCLPELLPHLVLLIIDLVLVTNLVYVKLASKFILNLLLTLFNSFRSKKLADCAGHFGNITLELPVFHAGFLKHTVVILQCICKQCSRLLLPLNERASYLKKLKNPKTDALMKSALFKKVVDTCKKNTICPHCEFSNGTVKKVTGTFKIIHEKYRAKQSEISSEEYSRDISDILQAHPDLKFVNQKAVENLNPVRAHELFSRMIDEDISLLWMQETYSRPDALILWTLPVPPVPIRPSVPQDQGTSNEDDLTIKLQEIVEINNALRLAIENGATMKMVAEDWEFLQVLVALFINGDTPGIPRQIIGPRNPRGLCQRLKGKQGRFRGNLSGKRVDFSGRTVISPDPNLRVDQVGVPVLVAKVMTYPERVHAHNIARLRQMIINGPDKHPGATIVRIGFSSNSSAIGSGPGSSQATMNGPPAAATISLHYANREEVARKLKIGDIVDRHMCDDDLVLFNRQPSLHKMSIMCHRVKVFPWRTFRFNECACTPYNADFDGDEMNLHLPQTEEARAEAQELMAIPQNLITSRHGVPLIAATQDFLMGAFQLTLRDVFLTRGEFGRLVSYLSDATEHIDVPPPTVWKPIPLWTGKQVISLLVRPNSSYSCQVNLESEEKFYSKEDRHFCRNDGFVCFRNGELISGSLGKKTLGGDSKTSLFYTLIRDFGAPEAIRCMTRLSKMTSRFLADRGCSIGVDDVTPSIEIRNVKTEVLEKGLHDANEQISLYKNGRIKLRPGCNSLQSLESELNGILSRVREKAGDKAVETLHFRNSPLMMANCGSKGAPLNISQMIACLGQQSVGGSRIQDGFLGRTLPHFPVGSLTPAAKGFVANSFHSGLTATEFFFHTMGGREGLVDTAVKTAETGYMARRMMKALEDLALGYDRTVRNSESFVVQFTYGDDGLNPQLMEKDDRPVDYARVFKNVCNIRDDSDEESLSSQSLLTMIAQELQDSRFTSLLPEGGQFLQETSKFFAAKANELLALENMEMKDESSSLLESKIDSAFNIRKKLSLMTEEQKNQWTDESRLIGTVAYHELHKIMRDNLLRITPSHVRKILEIALRKYHRATMEPGEAVGAVGAQSLSEPGTQMTLKVILFFHLCCFMFYYYHVFCQTFHFAGVASMNVTLGVPRLKEIINASKLISTPIIEARLLQSDSLLSARIAKAKIEKTNLGEICKYIKEVHCPEQSYVLIKLDMNLINQLHLDIDAQTVRQSILRLNTASVPISSRPAVLRALKDHQVQILSPSKGSGSKRSSKLMVLPPELKDNGKSGILPHQRTLFITQALKNALPKVIVQGISTVSRAVINEVEKAKGSAGNKEYYLLVEGYGLRDVMGCPGIDGTLCKTNHILEMQAVLGIEAARSCITSEIKYIMDAYGISVDRRHLLLLSDVMTFKGEILGITRFGVAKMKESVLMLASFEKTTDHLFDAAVHSREDSIVGVSECIIMGVPIPIGTGLFKLLHKAKAPLTLPVVPRGDLLLDSL